MKRVLIIVTAISLTSCSLFTKVDSDNQLIVTSYQNMTRALNHAEEAYPVTSKFFTVEERTQLSTQWFKLKFLNRALGKLIAKDQQLTTDADLDIATIYNRTADIYEQMRPIVFSKLELFTAEQRDELFKLDNNVSTLMTIMADNESNKIKLKRAVAVLRTTAKLINLIKR